MFQPNQAPPRRMHGWRGESGEVYWFSVFGLAEINDFDGIVYIAVRERLDPYFDPLYIGQSGQGGDRLSRHEKMPAARRLGATHIHIHFASGTASRFSIETDLRRQHWTPLNEQPTSAPVVGALPWLGIAPPTPFGFGGLGVLDYLPLAPAPPALPPDNKLPGFGNWETPFGFGSGIAGLGALSRSVK